MQSDRVLAARADGKLGREAYNRPMISVVAPCHNEAGALEALQAAVK